MVLEPLCSCGELNMELPGRRKKEKIKKGWMDGSGERGYGVGWCDRGRFSRQGKMETNDPL